MNGQKKQAAGVGEFCESKEMQELDLAGKAVAWYCLMGRQSKAPGVFVLDADKACKSLGTTKEDWNFYLELVVEELGWRWDAERNLLWITDYFNWVKVSKRELLAGLKALPETPWAEELSAQPPEELSPALQAAWRQWFFPVPPVEPTAQEKALDSITQLTQLTPELIPLVARRYLRRNTPAYIFEEFEVFLRIRSEFLASSRFTPPVEESPSSEAG